MTGRSVDELRVRGTQAVLAVAERAAAGSAKTDVFVAGAGTDEQLLERFRARDSPRISPAFAERDRTAAELRRRFAATTGPALVDRAERIVQGRFDILGFGDLSFGSPVDWHLDPVAGERAPLLHWSRMTRLDPRDQLDRKIVWELNRHHAFVVLGRAYWLTGDERYAETFARLLDDWIGANPPGLGINWTSSLEIALRIIAWSWALALFRDSSQLTPELFRRALLTIALQAEHVARYPSTYSSPNTHVTGEALGLFYAGTLWPELRGAATWQKAGLGTLLSSLPRHVGADGVYFERSTTYHLYTVDFYAHLARPRLGERNRRRRVRARSAGRAARLPAPHRPARRHGRAGRRRRRGTPAVARRTGLRRRPADAGARCRAARPSRLQDRWW